MTIKKSSLVSVIFCIIFVQGLFATNANAEEIPVLVWEVGQTQNVVLGKGDSEQNWDLYLKNQSGQKFQLSQSQLNQDNFSVYTITLPVDVSLGGYVVEAINSSTNEVKQVAGIQVIENSLKEITRVPLELLLVLLSFSLFLFMLSQLKGKTLNLSIMELESGTTIGKNLPVRILQKLENKSTVSLLQKLSLDEVNKDLAQPKLSLAFGLFALASLGFLQFNSGSWFLGNNWLVLSMILASVMGFSYGLLLSAISILMQALNIANAKSLSEILAIFAVSSIFVAPNLSYQFLEKNITEINFKFRDKLMPIFGAIYSGVTTYVVILVFESLQTERLNKGFLKEWAAVLVVLALITRNLSYKQAKLKFYDSQSEFQVVRSIGPVWTFGLSLFSSLVIYVWTTNLLVTVTSALSIAIILSLNWLEFNTDRFKFLPMITPLFALGINLVAIIAIYLSAQILPLDVINRSHMMILLVLPIDLILAMYLKLSSQNKPEQVLA